MGGSIIGGLSKFASNAPGMFIRIFSGLSGLLMKHATADPREPSPLGHLLSGNINGFVAGATMNYTGVDVWGNVDNSVGSMLRRMTAVKVAIIGHFAAKILDDIT